MPASRTKTATQEQDPKELAKPLHPSDAQQLRQEIAKHRANRPKKSPLELEREAEAVRKQELLREYKDELTDLISCYILNLQAKELSACVKVLVEALYTLEKSGANLKHVIATGTLKDRLQSWLQQEDRLNFGMALLVRAGLVERG